MKALKSPVRTARLFTGFFFGIQMSNCGIHWFFS